MTSQTRITAVIPAYNAAGSISRAVDSVLAQTHPVDEVIVVDDGSTDDTFEIASRFGTPVSVLRKENAGPSSARNLGVKKSSGDWIAFLDSDDTWYPNRISEQMEIRKRNPDIGLFCGRYHIAQGEAILRESQLGSLSTANPEERLPALKALACGCRIWTGTVLMQKALFQKVGGFNESLTTGEDQDLWFRIAVKTDVFGFVHDPIARYQVGNSSSLTHQTSQSRNQTWMKLIDRFKEARDGLSADRQSLVDDLINLKANQIVRNSVKAANLRQARWLIRELESAGVTGIERKWKILARCPQPLLSMIRRLYTLSKPSLF